MNHGTIQPPQRITISPVFAHLPTGGLAGGITDELLERWSNSVNSDANDEQPKSDSVPVRFLQMLRPGGPWVLIAIVPDGKPTVITARTADEVDAFVRKHNGRANLYYAVNPTRTAMTKKAKKTDIAAIEFISFDLDPRADETPEAAKARYLAQLNGSFEPKPAFLIDSGNGLNGAVQLSPRIELGEPVDGAYTADDLAKIATVEAIAKDIMQRLGSVAGTQNIDRILRLPGSTNLPNAAKRKAGRIARQTKLLRFDDVSYPLDALPRDTSPKQHDSQFGELPGYDDSGSGHGFRFMRDDCHDKNLSYEQARAAILADDGPAGEWANRVDERQLRRAYDNSKLDAAPTPAPASSLDVWDAGEDTEAPPPRGWLLGNSFCRRKVSSLIASSGVGKTALRILQGISLALGRSLSGEHIFVRTRVLIICLEDDKEELRRRVRAVLLRYGINRADLKGWLFLAAPGPRGGKLLTANSRTGLLTAGTLGPLIEAEAVKHSLGLVIVDPLVKAHGVNENSNDEMDALAQLLTDLADKLDLAIDAPHHVSKGPADPGNADRGRGASAMNAAARLVYSLSPMSPAEAEQFGAPEDERRGYVRLDRAKLNAAASTGPASWFRLVSVNIGNANETYPAGDDVQVAEIWNPPQNWAGIDQDTITAILNTIEHGLGDGNYYSAHNNAAGRAAWTVVIHHAPDKTEEQARKIIGAWIKNGLLYKFSYTHPETRKSVQGLRVNNKKRSTTRTAP